MQSVNLCQQLRLLRLGDKRFEICDSPAQRDLKCYRNQYFHTFNILLGYANQVTKYDLSLRNEDLRLFASVFLFAVRPFRLPYLCTKVVDQCGGPMQSSVIFRM